MSDSRSEIPLFLSLCGHYCIVQIQIAASALAKAKKNLCFQYTQLCSYLLPKKENKSLKLAFFFLQKSCICMNRAVILDRSMTY